MKIKEYLNEELLRKEADEILKRILTKLKNTPHPETGGKKNITPRVFNFSIKGKKLRLTLTPETLSDVGEDNSAVFYKDKNGVGNIVIQKLNNAFLSSFFETTLYHEIIHFIEEEKGRLKGKDKENYLRNPHEVNALINQLHKKAEENKKEWDNLFDLSRIYSFIDKHTNLLIPDDLKKDVNFSKKIISRIYREKFLPKKFKKRFSTPTVSVENILGSLIDNIDKINKKNE